MRFENVFCSTLIFIYCRFWCSTKVDNNLEHVGGEGNWGFCRQSCPTITSVKNQIGLIPKSSADLALDMLLILQDDYIKSRNNPTISPNAILWGILMLYYGMGDAYRNGLTSSLKLPNSKETIATEVKVI